jgi:hypothetical protein
MTGEEGVVVVVVVWISRWLMERTSSMIRKKRRGLLVVVDC